MAHYSAVIKKVPIQHLIDWLARHEDDSDSQQYKDYSEELEIRRAK